MTEREDGRRGEKERRREGMGKKSGVGREKQWQWEGIAEGRWADRQG